MAPVEIEILALVVAVEIVVAVAVAVAVLGVVMADGCHLEWSLHLEADVAPPLSQQNAGLHRQMPVHPVGRI